MQPDYGAFLYSQGHSSSVDIFLYDVPIDHISLTDVPSLTTMMSQHVDGVEYTVSFDFDENTDAELLAHAPEGTMERLERAAQSTTMDGRTVDLEPPIRVTLRVRLGPLQRSSTEMFAPLIVLQII